MQTTPPCGKSLSGLEAKQAVAGPVAAWHRRAWCESWMRPADGSEDIHGDLGFVRPRNACDLKAGLVYCPEAGFGK
jgi:hypothetical protein